MESRTLLDEEFFWLTSQQAETTLARVKRAGFNVFVPVVWHGRGTAWPSQRSPKEPRWEEKLAAGALEDPLANLIKRAHALGIEVHPWFTVGLRQRDFLPQFHDEGTPPESFNIHLPAFRTFIVDLIMEVVNRYDVDGINLDYVRSGMHHCDSRNYYCDVCVSVFCRLDYKAKTGRDLRADLDAVKADLDQTAFASIAQWNGAAMNEIVRTLSSKIRAAKPRLILSVDTHATYEWVAFQGANAVKWANQEWIDVIYHMEYDPLSKFRWPMIRRAESQLKDPSKLVLLVGNYDTSLFNKSTIWSRSARDTVEVMKVSQDFRKNGNGPGLYVYSYLSDQQIEALRAQVFTQPAQPSWVRHASQARLN